MGSELFWLVRDAQLAQISWLKSCARDPSCYDQPSNLSWEDWRQFHRLIDANGSATCEGYHDWVWRWSYSLPQLGQRCFLVRLEWQGLTWLSLKRFWELESATSNWSARWEDSNDDQGRNSSLCLPHSRRILLRLGLKRSWLAWYVRAEYCTQGALLYGPCHRWYAPWTRS